MNRFGIDLGLKTAAVTYDGEVFESRFYRNAENKIKKKQRRRHKKQIKRMHLKVKNRRKDAIHKFTRGVIKSYQFIFIGNVKTAFLAKTKMAKAVYDSCWGEIRSQLIYKGHQTGRSVEVVNEAYTSVTCSTCGSRSGPTGASGLSIRSWTCCSCGEEHDRDINAAINIRDRVWSQTSVSGNEGRK